MLIRPHIDYFSLNTYYAERDKGTVCHMHGEVSFLGISVSVSDSE